MKMRNCCNNNRKSDSWFSVSKILRKWYISTLFLVLVICSCRAALHALSTCQVHSIFLVPFFSNTPHHALKYLSASSDMNHCGGKDSVLFVTCFKNSSKRASSQFVIMALWPGSSPERRGGAWPHGYDHTPTTGIPSSYSSLTRKVMR